MRVLAGDIGGTKTLLQLADVSPGRYDIVEETRYDSGAYGDFSIMLQEFLAQALPAKEDRSVCACFGVAGAVRGNEAKTTNLPWALNARELESETGLRQVRLINDFQAVGYGIETLQPRDLVTLQEGHEQPRAMRAIIGAGTGLGHGLLSWETDHYEVHPSEGGHTDFAPTDELQIELLRFLREQFSHVSYERVVCGRGLVNIYEFLRESGSASESTQVRNAMASGDPAAAISEGALAGEDELCKKALNLFVQIYGAQAGNLALIGLATGGLYVAGGIAPKIIDKLADGTFIQAFRHKGQMRKIAESIPVRVITNAAVGLQGAAVAASRLT